MKEDKIWRSLGKKMKAISESGQLQVRGLLYLKKKKLYIIEANKHLAKKIRNCNTS